MSVGQELAECEASAALLRTEISESERAIEDGAAFGLPAKDMAARTKRLSDAKTSLQVVEAKIRGLRRRKVLEDRDALIASIAEAQAMAAQAETTYQGVRAAYERTSADYARLEKEVRVAAMTFDNEQIRVRRRQEQLETFVSAHRAELDRAEAVAMEMSQ